MNSKQSRLRRARRTRMKIAELKVNKLQIHRTNLHIYASIVSPVGGKILASASTVEKSVRDELAKKSALGGNVAAASLIGQIIAKKAIEAGVTEVAFDRSGFQFHGRVKALADAAREAGLKF